VSVVRIATRGSDLALAQADAMAGRIRKELGHETERIVVKTTGDRIQDIPLAAIGGKGLFVKEIEEALQAGRADMAVHSAKDLPARRAEGLVLAAFPERADPRDALVGRDPDATLAGLRRGARVGTGSARRSALLLGARPDLEIVPLRGNVPTRIAKIESEDLDAVVLACAGLDRLGLGGRISERLSTELMLPAVCQGTLALEVREGEALAKELARLTDPLAETSAAAERPFLERLEGDCTVPLAVHADFLAPDRLRVRGLLVSHDGTRIARHEETGAPGDARRLGEAVAEGVLRSGGQEILDAMPKPDVS
jgi:hydroxymethylbilane synthase